jgi:peptidoglycan hydrolase CwlO-like protein
MAGTTIGNRDLTRVIKETKDATQKTEADDNSTNPKSQLANLIAKITGLEAQIGNLANSKAGQDAKLMKEKQELLAILKQKIEATVATVKGQLENNTKIATNLQQIATGLIPTNLSLV